MTDLKSLFNIPLIKYDNSKIIFKNFVELIRKKYIENIVNQINDNEINNLYDLIISILGDEFKDQYFFIFKINNIFLDSDIIYKEKISRKILLEYEERIESQREKLKLYNYLKNIEKNKDFKNDKLETISTSKDNKNINLKEKIKEIKHINIEDKVKDSINVIYSLDDNKILISTDYNIFTFDINNFSLLSSLKLDIKKYNYFKK